MKKLFSCVCLLTGLSLSACHRDAVQMPAPIPTLTPTPKTVVEHRKTLTDSLTVTYAYDAQGQVQTESYLGYTVIYLYNPKNDPPTDGPGGRGYRTIYKNEQGKVVNDQRLIKFYFWRPTHSDSSVYENGRLIRQELKDYIFDVDGPTSIGVPFWLTKRSVTSDQQGRVISEQDSVFVTHDVLGDGRPFVFIAPKYIYSNQTTYQYNDRNEVTLQTAVSEANKLKMLAHTNGERITSWSRPAFFQAGTTTYQYIYRPDGLVLRKTATLRPVELLTEYISTFDYYY